MKPEWVTDTKPGQLFTLSENGSFCIRFIRHNESGMMAFRIEKSKDDGDSPNIFDCVNGTMIVVSPWTWHDEAWYVLRPVD